MCISESPTIEDYARSAHLTEKQLVNLNSLIEGVVQRKEMHMVLLGMPLGAWSELFYLFNRIVSSGFVGTVDSMWCRWLPRDTLLLVHTPACIGNALAIHSHPSCNNIMGYTKTPFHFSSNIKIGPRDLRGCRVARWSFCSCRLSDCKSKTIQSRMFEISYPLKCHWQPCNAPFKMKSMFMNFHYCINVPPFLSHLFHQICPAQMNKATIHV